MFDIGFTEMMLVGVISLVVLGPERLPQVARKVGRFIGNSRRMFYKFQHELMKETSELEQAVKSQLSSVEETVKHAKQDLQGVFSLDHDKDHDLAHDYDHDLDHDYDNTGEE